MEIHLARAQLIEQQRRRAVCAHVARRARPVQGRRSRPPSAQIPQQPALRAPLLHRNLLHAVPTPPLPCVRRVGVLGSLAGCDTRGGRGKWGGRVHKRACLRRLLVPPGKHAEDQQRRCCYSGGREGAAAAQVPPGPAPRHNGASEGVSGLSE